MAVNRPKDWIRLKSKRKLKDAPSEILIDSSGNVYLDGILYREDESQYENIAVDVERYTRMNSGEDTQKILEKQKQAKKGETVTIRDIKSPNRSETTTVKF